MINLEELQVKIDKLLASKTCKEDFWKWHRQNYPWKLSKLRIINRKLKEEAKTIHWANSIIDKEENKKQIEQDIKDILIFNRTFPEGERPQII